MGRVKEQLIARQYELPFEDLKEDGFSPKSSLRELEDAEASEVILSWFHTFFEDPAQETPYIGREGGYLYIWGGPYFASEVVFDAFHDLASEEAMQLAVDELADEGWEWAPSSFHPDQVARQEEYEWESHEWMRENDPRTIFQVAIEEIDEFVGRNAAAEGENRFLLTMSFAQCFSALEAFLFDRLRRLFTANETAMVNFAKSDPKVRAVKFSVEQVLTGKADVKALVLGQLESRIFHRFENVMTDYENACDMSISRTDALTSALKALKSDLNLRHHCVHRNGKDHDGAVVHISADDIRRLMQNAEELVDVIDTFVNEFEAQASPF